MLREIYVILITLWLLGLISGLGGPLIHTLLMIATGVLIYNLIRGQQVAL